jgi:hypothetical protein
MMIGFRCADPVAVCLTYRFQPKYEFATDPVD